MRRVFSKLLYETEHGGDVMLVTVVRDRGSAPRGAGAGMLVGAGGRITGTVGGGAVEYNSERIARELLAKKQSGTHDFTLRRNEREDIGMMCGGDVTVLFSYIAADDLRWQLLAGAVCDRIAAAGSGWLLLPLDGGPASLYGEEGLLAGEAVAGAETLCGANPALGAGVFCAPLPRSNRVVIFGGGHICQALVPLLGAVEFRAAVFDNRPEYSRPELFPGAEEVICGDFDRVADRLTVTSEDFVVIMTNGHAFDMTVEDQMLRLPTAYVGVIGSRSKIARVRAALTERGITAEQLDRVHTPIGTAIKAVTPAEIAVSILGELILCRAELRENGAPEVHGCPM